MHEHAQAGLIDATALISRLSRDEPGADRSAAWSDIDTLLASDHTRESVYALAALGAIYLGAWATGRGMTLDAARAGLAELAATEEH